jgi:AcrR family transcriptional regulator
MTNPEALRLRPGQRRRTRKAIVDATMELVAEGRTPSVAEIAEAAEVSRRTVYLYFPTLEQLLLDATVGALSRIPVDEALEAIGPNPQDPAAGVEALARALSRASLETMDLGRALVRLTVERGERDELVTRRGYRRVEWIEKVLGPLRGRLSEPRFERLVSALAVVLGWEALIVLQDIRGIDTAAQEDVTAWAARALVDAALAES